MKNYHIKAYKSEIENWKESAENSNLNVSAWVRGVLDCIVLGQIKPSYSETQMVRGRDPDREEMAESFQFRATSWEKQEWVQCADREGLTIGEWIRQSLDYGSDCNYVIILSNGR